MTTPSSDRSRQPKGIPVGGQFATSARAEADVDLDELAAENAATIAVHVTTEAALDAELAHERERDAEMRRWGSVDGVQEGARTPWGRAQNVTHPAPGIVVASCAGHGGVKLSPERNKEIPSALRNSSGWYEEDCESQIVGMHFPETFPHYRGAGVDLEDMDQWRREQFTASVKNWFPDQYTKATGIKVATEESSVLRDRAKEADKEAFRAAHSDQFVTLGHGDIHATWIPKGYAACEARLDDTGETRTFLMPRDEVITNHSYGRHAPVDPNRHLDVTDVVATGPDRPWVYARNEGPTLTGDELGIDRSGLTATQSDRAYSELNKRWRFQNDDGTQTVESLGEHMARVGVVGKKPHSDGNKVDYWVEYPGGSLTLVSKATYDALTGVPDTSSDYDRASLARDRAQRVLERARDNGEKWTQPEKYAKKEADYRAKVKVSGELSDAQSKQSRAWAAERDQMRIERFAELASARDLSFEARD